MVKGKSTRPVRQDQVSAIRYTSTANWSGYVADNGGFKEVQGTWNTPCWDPINPPHNAAVSWIGFGGWNGTRLWQGGTTEDPIDGYHFWWQFVPDFSSIQVWSAPTLHCGEVIYAYADWNVSYANRSYVVLVDETLNVYVSTTYNSQPGLNSAEWIDERPTCTDIFGNNRYYPLTMFRYTSWRGADADNGGSLKAVGLYNPWDVEMFDGQGILDAYPDPDLGADNESWTDHWNNAGDGTC